MRVSDSDRERAARQLQRAFSEGRLDEVELEDRLELALTAKTYADLIGLVSDLPSDEPRADEVVELESASGTLKRSGDWAVPRRLRASSRFGSVKLDLSGAVIEHPVVEIELDLPFGSAWITLPEGATANVDGFRTDWGRVACDVPGRRRPEALYVVITGRATYGKLTVRYPRRRRSTH
ncbi:protein of unknown function [Nonomuraea maritima]|uniref:DUF1707 domain-containing protein n=2 Tax=Nonomuraea maritima TaxID=683260 RepID=A0A1G8UVQ0_9ACTN|nr:protein of unknown function [Nonomuraea maritima]